MRSAPVENRGVALILVLVTIAILTSIGVDFSYSSRVSLKLAENLRDETRAEYLARSAINLGRLLLHFVLDSVPGAGHFLYEEQPAAVVTAVDRAALAAGHAADP